DQIVFQAGSVAHRHFQSASHGLLRGEELRVIPDRSLWNAGFQKFLLPMRRRIQTYLGLDEWNELASVSNPVGIGEEAWIVRPLRALGGPAKPSPLVVVADREDQPTIAGRECLVGHDLQMGVALPGRNLPAR